jgi:nucleotide-binding universal stress UspA family protein
MPDFPQRIVVATDGSEGATLAVEAASEIAAGTDSELHLVHVWPGPPLPPVDPSAPMADDLWWEPEREARELLRRQAWSAKIAGATVAEEHLKQGHPAGEIAALARELDADLVVVGRRERGALGRLFLGGVSNKVARDAPCPILVVRGGWPPSRVVVGDDLSEEAETAGALAAIIGGLYGVPVRLTTAYLPSKWYVSYAAHSRRVRETERRIDRELEERATVLGRALEEQPYTEVARKRPDEVLQGTPEGGKATLVAIGSRGLGAVKRAVLGSVSAGVLRAASGPVLIAPPSTDEGVPNGERRRKRPRHRGRQRLAPLHSGSPTQTTRQEVT